MRPSSWLVRACLLGTALGALAGWLLLAGSANASRPAQHARAAAATSGGEGVASPTGAGAELTDLRTARSRTWEQGRGTRLTRVFSTAVNYKDARGQWQAIDNTLVPDGAGGFAWHNAANAYSAELPSTLASPLRFSLAGASLTLALEGASGTGAAAGNRATYHAAFPGVTASYAALGDSLQETLRLADSGVPTRYRYRLGLSAGLTAHAGGDGSVFFVDASGHQVFSLRPPIVSDAALAISRQAVRLELGSDPSGTFVDLVVDGAWLRSPSRRFPVVVDPTISSYGDYTRYYGADTDCYISTNAPTFSYCGYATDYLGYNGTDKYRWLMYFNVTQGGVPHDADVQYARFGAYFTSQTGSTAAPVSVYNPTKSWNAHATWNTYDGTNNWTTPGGDYSSNALSSDLMTSGIPAWYVNFTITSLVQGWLDGSSANNGLIFKSDEQTNNLYGVDSSSESTGNYRPFVDVIWEPRMGIKPQYTIDSQQLWDRSSVGVNVANGNLVLTNKDLTVHSRGLDLSVTRVYNGLGLWRTNARGYGETGQGVSMSVGLGVEIRKWANGDETFYDKLGAAYHFTNLGNCQFQAPPGFVAKMWCDANGYYVQYLQSGEKLTFPSADKAPVSVDQDRYGNKITYTYQPAGTLTGITDADGRTYTVTHSTINGNSLITAITDSSGGRTWKYGYNTQGTWLTSVTDPANNVTTYSYDPTSYDLTKIIDPNGHEIDITYDSWHRVTSIIRKTADATNPTTIYSYPVPEATHCDTSTTSYEMQVQDPNGGNSYYCADRNSHVLRAVDQAGHQRSATWNTRNNVATAVAAGTGSQTSTLVYEQDQSPPSAWDNLLSATGPTGEATTMGYNHGGTGGWTNGNSDIRNYVPWSVQGPSGQPKNLSWDATGNLTDVSQNTAGSGGTTIHAHLDYNADGTLKDTIDGNGRQTNYTYYGSDANHDDGLLQQVSPPSVTAGSQIGTTTYTYDAIGRTHTIKDGKAQTTTISYDTLDRVTKQTFNDGSWISYTYDPNGNLTQQSDSAGNTYTYKYDELGRRTSDTGPGTTTHTYTYDRNGNLKSLTDAGGTVSYDYNPNNTLKDLAEPGGTCTAPTSLCTTFPSYDAHNNRLETDYPNGVALKATYNNADQMTGIGAFNGSTTLRNFSYCYATSGCPSSPSSTTSDRVQTRTDQAGHVTYYTYDGLRRLTDGSTFAGSTMLSDYNYYSYDGAGNLLQSQVNTGSGYTVTSRAYNEDNLLCWQSTGASSAGCGSPPTGATSYSYDSDGNDSRFTYNAKNQLTNAFSNPLSYLGANNALITGDGAASVTPDLLGTAYTTTSGASTYYTRDNRGTLIDRRLPGGGREYYTFDDLGSVTALDDASANNTLAYSYDPYGNATRTGSGAANPFQYGGAYSSHGLDHLGLRWYDPTIVRWSQQDPVNNTASLTQGNRYAYAGDDPVNNADPSGSSFYRSYAGGMWGLAGGAAGSSLAYAAGGEGLLTPGGVLGAAAGSAVGEAIGGGGSGAAEGTSIGSAVGAGVGGALGELASPVGGIVGGTVGGAVGGAVGEVVGDLLS